jgi:hypothetical protein
LVQDDDNTATVHIEINGIQKHLLIEHRHRLNKRDTHA